MGTTFTQEVVVRLIVPAVVTAELLLALVAARHAGMQVTSALLGVAALALVAYMLYVAIEALLSGRVPVGGPGRHS